ncbi:hypothetical protein H8M03_11305 [Sphingomonas sabuli]|uniref:RcnB family protein n=1 Tax=Sphingomonas sabuli TaxID=2764186 RepID=A0A7G9L1S8_9SPHN|nr:hypothetical protein [Sphingomonas sabuli]QNM82577.1 hypothetical protein H8M03_11305 [Sphingomonas sabuli]
MKTLFILAGVAALTATAPAAAKPGKGHGHGNSHATHAGKHGGHNMYGYGTGNCPPGLAKKNAMCMPPGQFKKLHQIGQRYPNNYGNLWSYNQIPVDLRTQYGFNDNYRYYYGDGYLYQVDPRTMLIQQVVNAILR